MSDYFPPEIILQILHKLPAKSLIRFITVCKSWRSIITSPSFISSYLYKPRNETLLLRRYDMEDKQERYSLLEVSKNRPFTITSSSELELPLKSQDGCFRIEGSCRGVICLLDGFHGSYPTIILCNPCIKKHFVLPKPTIHPKWFQYYALGFGVAHDDFKVVRLVYTELRRVGFIVSTEPEAEVFSIREGSWRRLGIDVRLPNLYDVGSHVFLNGAMHWIGYTYNPVTKVGDVSILLFHIAQEVFDEIELPKELPIKSDHYFTMTLIGESLAVTMLGEGSCEVWLMKEYGDEGSWTRLYSFVLKRRMENIVALRENGEALGADGVGLVTFDLENLEAKNLGIQGTPYAFYVEDYVESLELLTSVSGNLKEFSLGAEES